MAEVGPLSGFTIGVTAVRRRHEFGTALEHRGARVVYAPAMKIVSPADDPVLHEATRQVLAGPLDHIVVTTAIGVRAWLDAAQGWGLGEQLRERLAATEVSARGPKARGALRSLGVAQAWAPPVESVSDLIEQLLRGPLRGARVAVQVHGAAPPDLLATLRGAGAEVVEVTTFGWLPPDDKEPLRQLVQAVAARQVDAVAFTSAAGAAGLLHAAEDEGQGEQVRAALGGAVLPACIGSIAAGPLERVGLAPVRPIRPRLGALVREISEQVPSRVGRELAVGGHRLDVRGHAVLVDGVLVIPGAAAMSVLKSLARLPGQFVESVELARALAAPGSVDEAVLRLRAAVGDSRIVQGIPGGGYRLAHDSDHAAGCGHDTDA